MSQAKKLVINCGASHLSVAVFSLSNGIELVSYQTRSLACDLNDESQWLAATIGTLREILAQNSSFKGKARIILPGHLLLTKSIKVPLVEASRQAQIIAFEAQQSIPYPLSEVEWGKQVIADDGVESEVLVAAVKSDLATSLSRQMMSLGLQPEWVSAAPVLDYNTYRQAYPEISQETLIINMGSRSSNLIFANQEGFFIRNLGLGGNSLTQSIADGLQINFSQAEILKIEYLSDQLSEGDSRAAVVEKTCANFMARLSQDITRSIVTYRQQRKGSAPQLILLTGKASLLNGLSEFLGEKQRVSVDYFDCLKNVELGNALDLEALQLDRYQLSEAVGEVGRDVLQDSAGIDLTPKSIAESMAFSKKKPFLYLAVALLAVSFIPPILQYGQATQQIQAATEKARISLAEIEGVADEIAQNIADAESLQSRLAGIEALVNSKFNWINFFSDLQQRMLSIEDVWLDDLKVDRSLIASEVVELEEGDDLDDFDDDFEEEDFQEEVPLLAKPTDYKLIVKGRLLIRQKQDADSAVLTEGIQSRIKALVEGMKESEFVESYTNLKIDFNPIRTGLKLVPFEVTLNIDPEKPL